MIENTKCAKYSNSSNSGNSNILHSVYLYTDSIIYIGVFHNQGTGKV